VTLDLRYYLTLFWRRLPLFLLVAGLISGLGVSAALLLPPAYVSQAVLTIESAQIPDSMVGPTVDIPPEEQLELFQTKLLTRSNMLAIARKVGVFDKQETMNPDQIVQGMRARTSVSRQAGRDRANVMTISFEARSPQIAAAVLNEYLTVILQQDAEDRGERASQTQDFFRQEVERLGQALDAMSERILKFKDENADALPDSLDYRRNLQLSVQERVAQADRETATLREQRAQLVATFESTGRIDAGQGRDQRSPEQRQLDELRSQLDQALLVYSPENPTVKLLQRRVEQLEKSIADSIAAAGGDAAGDAAPADPARALLDLQLAQIDSRIAALEAQRQTDQAQLDSLNDSIARTPANQLALQAMERDYDNLQAQYNNAVARQAQASTGERVEVLARGEKISVVEQPSVPSEPSRPNRRKIALAGIAAGLAAGFGLLVLLEMLNGTARRPADLVARLGLAPIASIPLMRTRREILVRRTSQTAAVVLVLVAVPAALAAVHYYYLPLDLIADRVMSRFGLRG
jgi:polysaccharide chain length determinant protein (PEP-CTERM system associated)